MKRFVNLFRTKRDDAVKQPTQEELLKFVIDERNIEKAVEGSMTRRLELLDRVELKEKHA